MSVSRNGAYPCPMSNLIRKIKIYKIILGYIGIAYLPCTPSFSSMICTTINRELSSHV